MSAIQIKDFYKEIFSDKLCEELDHFLTSQIDNQIGHFNVFDISELTSCKTGNPAMPYNRRTYYKISLLKGHNRVEYADKVLEVNGYGVLFATPKVPYRYFPLSGEQGGHFCVFTNDFMSKSKVGVVLDELPIYKPNSGFIYEIAEKQYKEIEQIFQRMHREKDSDYQFKYDLLRTLVLELIHTGQKLTPVTPIPDTFNASVRIFTLFIELLERQFPADSPGTGLSLHTPKDFADALHVHVNHLNKVLKEVTGKTTSEIISGRITQEAKVMLKQTTLNVSEIAYRLGFEEVAHFSNFFKKHTSLSPVMYRV